MAGPNPYSLSRTENEFAEPEYAEIASGYAVPTGDAPYNDEFGWSPSLRLSPTQIPDTSRLGREPVRDGRPPAGEPAESYWIPRDADEKSRHSVEQIDADGWEETKSGFGYADPNRGANRWVRNPRENPPAEDRPTMRMAPRSYNFWRPFGTGTPKIGAKFFSGVHFSMADHRRDYEIYGMQPVRTHRNTYRLEPTPWDTNIVDMPPPDDFDLEQVVVNGETNYGSRNWRL